jgi:hypothetical protein
MKAPIGLKKAVPPKPPWAARVSRPKLVLAAALAGSALWIVGGALDWLVVQRFLPPLPMVLADFLVGVLAAALIYRTLVQSRSRYEALLERLEVIGEMNHHIRNALQVIDYHNRTDEREHAVQQVSEAVTRIEWTLREVLPPRK